MDRVNLFYLLIILIITFFSILVYLEAMRGVKRTVKSKKLVFPKIIWSYWDTDNLPKLQKNIYERRVRLLPNYKHIVVTQKSLTEHIKRPVPKGFYDLKPQAQSDWVRLALLEQHGGCWMDIAIIINSPKDFNNIYADAIEKKADVTGFYLEHAIIPNRPLTFFESWFILAPRGSKLVKEWLRQFEKAIVIGFDAYRKLTEIPYECGNIYKAFGTYLTVHVTFRVALKDMIDAGKEPIVIAYRAEDTMYKLKAECEWHSTECIMNRLRDDPSVKNIPYIKINGKEATSGIDISRYFES
jgi:hypothetical protein